VFTRSFSSDDREAPSATLLILPVGKHQGEAKDAHQTTASLLTQSPEDLRLAERIESALYATGCGVLRDIKVFVNARIVHLVGRVPSYLKQVAQATALATLGTHRTQNYLDVIPLN
jgi:osmotically-inducible protein OsmY